MNVNAAVRPGMILLADIGGTNCRLALQCDSSTVMMERAVYSTDDYPSPSDAIAAFLKENGSPTLTSAALAIAAPVTDDVIELTNQSWSFDRAKLRRALGLERLVVVNDLAAQARAVLTLPPSDLMRIGQAEPTSASGTIAVLGPGTGLGVGRLDRGATTPVTSTEGGHVGFAPNDDVEVELLRLWRPHLGRVTNEHILSGPGLVRLYRALGALQDLHVEPIQGPEIMRRALANEDALCVEAVERFAKVLGSVSGDVVLAQGAVSCVLVGSIANALAPVLHLGGFRARFEQRGPGGGILQSTPTLLATAPDLGLIGARALLDDAERVFEKQ